MSGPGDPGAAAAKAAGQAADRAASAARWRRALAIGAPPAGGQAADPDGDIDSEDRWPDRIARAQAALADARQRARAARVRSQDGLLRAALAHERAAALHDQAGQSAGPAACEHRRQSETHRAGAGADRRRAAEIDPSGS